MESFWSTLKCGLVHREHFVVWAQAQGAIFRSFEWIEFFYNWERFYDVLGYKSPVDFETQLN